MSELLGANTDVLDRRAEALSVDARRVQDIRALAQRALGELQASWNGSDLLCLTQQWEQQASPLLGWASTSLDTCAAELRAQSAAQQVTSRSNGDGAGVHTPWKLIAPQPTPPPGRGSPADNAIWWTSMTAAQQNQVIREHPEWIGNRDGVAFAARDLANRRLLTAGTALLMAEQKRIQAGTADFATRGPVTVDEEALERVKDKRSSIQAIQATLAGDGPRQLLMLDLGKERAEAAIANGDVDTAANVAVFVPGMTTTVNGLMKGYDQQMKHLQQRAESEGIRAQADQAAASTATVTWIGYQAPQIGDVLKPGTSVASLDLARTGAAQLAPFLQGIGAAREQDAHLSLLGHSYGSTTAGLALQQETGVDDVVFFGSPGLGTNCVADLDLPPGHAYYIEAGWDLVGDLGVFGMDPSHLSGIEHASARDSIVRDPVTGEIRTFTGVTGHNAYLVDDSTSQYNMSVIVAGEPDRRVDDRGQGGEDGLSRQDLGTYR